MIKMSRRDLLRSGAYAMAGLATSPGWLRLGGVAHASGAENVLVSVFLRGAADGLSLVVPHGDPDYYDLRPNIQVAPGDEIDLDGFYGLHPHLQELEPLYRSGEMALIHACGSPHPTRSHFQAQDFMECAAPGRPDIHEGWLNRTVTALGGGNGYSGVSIGGALSLSLKGPEPVVSMAALDGFAITNDPFDQRRQAIEAVYGSNDASLLGEQVSNTFASIDGLQGLPQPSVDYPNTSIGQRLRDAARIIKGRVGARVLSVDLDGWDHHSDEVEGMDKMAPQLSQALAAFWADLGRESSRVVCLVMTEFGRTVAENGSLGSDHGHGSALLALGGPVAGDRVLTRNGWPGLDEASLYQGRDLAVTTDFRDVFAEVLDRHLGIVDLDPVFPDFSPSSADYPGLLG